MNSTDPRPRKLDLLATSLAIALALTLLALYAAALGPITEPMACRGTPPGVAPWPLQC